MHGCRLVLDYKFSGGYMNSWMRGKCINIIPKFRFGRDKHRSPCTNRLRKCKQGICKNTHACHVKIRWSSCMLASLNGVNPPHALWAIIFWFKVQIFGEFSGRKIDGLDMFPGMFFRIGIYRRLTFRKVFELHEVHGYQPQKDLNFLMIWSVFFLAPNFFGALKFRK